MSNKPVIIFDWDGTLVDSIGTISEAIVSSAHVLGETMDHSSARQVIGLGLSKAVEALFPHRSEEVHRLFVDEYKARILPQANTIQPFSGVQNLLDRLKADGVPMAVATGKSRHGLDIALDALEWNHYFEITRCADETESKPHPKMIHEILEGLQRQPVALSQVFMIGDTTHDIHLAHNARVKSVALTTGAHSVNQLTAARPDLLCHDLESAVTWVLQQV